VHPDLSLFTTITAALVAAFAGGYAARRLGLPTLVGYLVAGTAIGPFTPGFVGDRSSIEQLAEMGVIFMMFGVGLHFSLRDLWRVRRVAVPGALLQMTLATAGGALLARSWGWSVPSAVVLGLAISIASTIVLLRGLMDNGLLNTEHGRTAVGWLVLEDLATVAILVLMPALVAGGGSPWAAMADALVKTAAFVALMLLVGARLIPWLLERTALTRSRELFTLAVVAIALGTALGAAELFGVSLALGAFLAGAVIGESRVGHQVGAEILPFREVFAVLFFVSVGMLVDPASLIADAPRVLALAGAIVAGKLVITLLMGTVLPASGRTMLVVAAGLSQIGEFSFLVGQSGLALGLIDRDQYALLLSGALVSIIANPLLFRAIEPAERWLRRLGTPWRLLDRREPPPAPRSDLRDHVVLVGHGRVGEHIGTVLERLGVPLLVVERDLRKADDVHARGLAALFGDAANSEILDHARLGSARALVVTVPDETAAELVVAAARRAAPGLPVVARAGSVDGVERLADLGASHVIQPELEGGLELVRLTLLALGYGPALVSAYTDAVRRDRYQFTVNTAEERSGLASLMGFAPGMEVTWRTVAAGSPIAGRTLAGAGLRANTGASVIAIVRGGQVMANPKSDQAFAAGDLVGLIGEADQLAAATAQIEGQVEGWRGAEGC